MSSCSNACEYPVRQIFFSEQNILIIANLVSLKSNVPRAQVTGDFLTSYMKPIFEAAPAPALTDADMILDHVQALNTKVAQWAAQDAYVGSKMSDHHLKFMTGTRPVIDRPQAATEYGQTRGSTAILLPRYTQFYEE